MMQRADDGAKSNMRVSVLVLVFVAGACTRDPHALITVEDPSNLATRAVTLTVAMDDATPKRIASTTFPASVAIASDHRGAALIRIDALDANDVVLARGAAAVELVSDNRTATSLILSRPCINDAGCDDARSCNGSERCSENRCVAGVPLIIDDGDPCSDDSCTEAAGVVHVPTAGGTPCQTVAVDGICIAGACVAASCGDGFTTAPEQCDDGANGDVCDRCTDTCTSIATYSCGDGLTCGAEVCDNGSANSDAACTGCCRFDCRPQACDDGVVDPNEVCDDGGASGWDGCASCTATERQLSSTFDVDSDRCEVPAVLIGDNGAVSFSVRCYECIASTCATVLVVTQTPAGQSVARSEAPHASAFVASGAYVYVRLAEVSPFSNYIAARSYGSGHAPLGAEVTLVAAAENVNYTIDSVTTSPSGQVVIAYTRDAPVDATTDYYVRSYGAAPTYAPLSSAIAVASPSLVATLGDNDFFALQAPGAGPNARHYAMAGTLLGPELGLEGSVVYKNGIGGDPNTRFIVLSGETSAGQQRVFAQRFLASGAPDGIPVAVAGPTTGGANGVIDVASDGSAVIGWSALCETSAFCPVVRTFDATQQTSSAVVRASIQSFNAPVKPHAIRKLADGTIVLVWSAEGSDGSPALYATHFNSGLEMQP